MSTHVMHIDEGCQPQDGVRALVDRVWPRGVSRSEAQRSACFRDIAPSPDLRQCCRARQPQFNNTRAPAEHLGRGRQRRPSRAKEFDHARL